MNLDKFFGRIAASKMILWTMLIMASASYIQCESATDVITDILISPSDDVNLGRQIDNEIRSNPSEYPLLGNAAANQYLQDMSNEIITAPQIKYRGRFVYKVEIVRDDKTVNAFCTPGGYIYVYTGLIKMLDNEASLAGVMGHEIAHAERRHAANRMVKQYGVSLILSMALGNNPTQLAELGANLFGNLALLSNSRSDESEADADSFSYLQSTKWYPGGVKFFFEKISGQSGSSGFERLFSTHPLPQDRVDDVNELIAKANLAAPSETNLRSVQYQAFKAMLP